MRSVQNLSQNDTFSKSKSSTDRSQPSSCNENGREPFRPPTETDPVNGQFAWFDLYQVLMRDESLQKLFIDNLNHLFVSKQRFSQIKNKNPVFEELVNRYQSRNCLKAISAARDLSSVKINQYKFLYHGFSLGTATKLVIRESSYLYKSLLKRDNPMKELRRLVSNWISYLFVIHAVPENARTDLKMVVLESIELSLKLAPKTDELLD